jgi:AcrR family transcriptional regulator
MARTKPEVARSYHHGDLKAALIEESFHQLGESGVAGFSVAKLARAVGVSAAAPYRHFADRTELIATVASVAATDLLAATKAAVAPLAGDPQAQLARAAGVYVRFVVERGIGADVMFSPDLREVGDGSLARAGQSLVAFMIDLASETPVVSMEDLLTMLDEHLAIWHGYATLYRDGFYAGRIDDLDDIVRHAEQATVDMMTGFLARLGSTGEA